MAAIRQVMGAGEQGPVMEPKVAGARRLRWRLTETEFIAFDLETTGLFPVVNRILEFGAVQFRLHGRELDVREQSIDPECLIPPEVTDSHATEVERTYRLDRIQDVRLVET
jgi:DNA polymerase III alpha subunit (gram-positive type)